MFESFNLKSSCASIGSSPLICPSFIDYTKVTLNQKGS